MLLLLALSPLLAAVTPHASHPHLVSANGLGVVALNGADPAHVVLDRFHDRLYQRYTLASDPVRDLLYDAYFGVDTLGGWRTAATSWAADEGTGILRVDRSEGDLGVEEVVFAPMDLPVPGFVHLLRVENRGTTSASPHLFSLANFHVGTDDDGDGITEDDEAIWMDDGVLHEVGNASGLGMVSVPLVAVSTFTCDQGWTTVAGGGTLDGRCGTAATPWTWDDQVGVLQWDVVLAPGESAWVGVVHAFFDDHDAGMARADVAGWVAGRDPEALVAAETAGWAAWHGAGTPPAEATVDELALYRQSLAFLRMAQVREANDAYGQIPASFPLAAPHPDFSHAWNITWVRDSAYAIRALTDAGYLAEARAALAFLLQGKAGTYAHLVGQDYAVSVCRCTGDGSEESDDDGTGPNVEFDNFGLLLWALGTWTTASGDLSLLEDRRAVVLEGLADVLAGLVEEDPYGEGLIRADSSIWERHWNGNQKHFTYTSAWAVRGLREAATLADLLGDGARAARYRAAADTVRGAMCTWLRSPEGALAGSLEELDAGDGWLDLAAVDALNNGTLDAAGPTGAASLAAWMEGLAVPSGHGYRRNDDGGLYDLQEWVIVDLRLAEALRRACRVPEAEAIEGWLLAQALENHRVLPELLDDETGDYAGPAPMMGFGAGAWVLALHARGEAAADCADAVTWTCDDGPPDTGGGGDTAGDTAPPGDTDPPQDTGTDSGGAGGKSADGCRCGAGPGGLPHWPAALLALALVRRRRKG